MAGKLRIGIIDSGVNQSELSNSKITDGINIGIHDDKIIMYGDGLVKEKDVHGTRCARIIEKLSPESQIFSIRIMSSAGRCRMETLVAAINWAIENNLHILNLSLATTSLNQLEKLRAVCKTAFEKNIIMVGAKYNNIKTESYPADLEYVISVGIEVINRSFLFHPNELKLKILISYNNKLCNKKIWVWKELVSNSFATAFIVGFIAKKLGTYTYKNWAEVLQTPGKFFADSKLSAKLLIKFMMTLMPLYKKVLKPRKGN